MRCSRLSAQLTGLKLAATSFSSSAVFRSTTATSSNPSILGASSTISSPVGSYAFTVQRTAAASQVATQGFANALTAIGDSGVVPVDPNSLKLTQPLKLSQLNGGNGVKSGSIQITARDNTKTTVDLSAAVTIQDVVNTINGAGAKVTAAISNNDKLVLTDTSGGNSNALSVANVASGTTATDLGLTFGAIGNTLTSADLNRLSPTTTLSTLNDGNGVRSTGTSLPDFAINVTTNGAVTSYNVALNGSTNHSKCARQNQSGHRRRRDRHAGVDRED